jgi:hypothetical protein
MKMQHPCHPATRKRNKAGFIGGEKAAKIDAPPGKRETDFQAKLTGGALRG